MRKYIILITTLLLSFILLRLAWAGYSGPTVIYSATLSDMPSDGENKLDVFDVDYFVKSDGTYVENLTGADVSIYGPSGLIKTFSVSQGPSFQAEVHFSDQAIYVFGSVPDASGTILDNLYIYGYDGKIITTLLHDAYKGGFESALSSGDFITRDGKTDNYYRYSLPGQLVKSYTSRPLELGIVKSQPLPNGKYLTTITYDDRSCTILNDVNYSIANNFLRDENKNLYSLGATSVYKFSPCGKLLGQVDMPEDVVFREKNVTGREPEYMQHDMYGEPQMDIHGNVYTWKKTPNEYYILKWTWMDDPSDPSAGPDAPQGLTVSIGSTGVSLIWTASPQDPGCVTGYEIARTATPRGATATVATVKAGVLKYIDTSASAGSTYYYKIRAVSGSRHSVFTKAVSGKR